MCVYVFECDYAVIQLAKLGANSTSIDKLGPPRIRPNGEQKSVTTSNTSEQTEKADVLGERDGHEGNT